MQQSAGVRRDSSSAAAGGSAASGGSMSSAAPRASSGASTANTARQRSAGRPAARPGASAGGGLQPLQQKLQQHIDREDRRIKELTEGILYEFFPAALRAVLPPGGDPALGLSAGAARSVAAAALTVATLMNAPPGFLEFLLCVPWAELGPLYLQPEREECSGAPAVPQLLTSQGERAALVNVRLDPDLMDCVLDFLYREQHRESLPPMIRLAPPAGSLDPEIRSVADPGGVTRDMVAALLDGATPLHCAAIRGNPAQVDHLLLCGADPLLTNAAGELPLEVVPVCGDRCLGNGKLSCRCMGPRDQEAWECRSRLARTLILRRCAVQFRNGLSAWFRMALLCLMCLLGFWGNHTTLHRAAIEQHASRRAEAQRRRLLQQTQATLLKMRTNAASGRQALDGGAGSGSRGGGEGGGNAAAAEPPEPHEQQQQQQQQQQQRPASDGGGGGMLGGSDSYMCSAGAAPGAPGERSAEDYAYACYSQAVHLLKELDLRPGSIPGGYVEAAGPNEDLPGGPSARVFPDEQAAIYCGWAEAALRKARACGCAGCAALATHAVSAGQKHVATLLASPELARGREGERVARVGAAMARLVHCKAALLLASDVRHSATRAGVWRAQQCLQEWERLRNLRMAAGLGEDDCLDLQCLEAWWRAASADLLLLEALLGRPLPPCQPLGEALTQAVSVDPSTGVPTLLRPVGRDVVRQLMSALAAAKPHASEHILRVAEAVAGSLQLELSAGDRLRDLLQPRSGGMNVEDLTAAIRAAERYPSLQPEVAQARALKERWIRRAEAQTQFDAAVEALSGPASQTLLTARPDAPPAIDAEAFWLELNSRLQRLEAATEEARQANIGVAKAKRVLKELQAQGAAVEAAAKLDDALSQPRCASAALKAALAKAEAAAAAAAPGACQFAVGAELLLPRIQAAKHKLEVERAAEGLSRAAATCKAVADLPRLEAAILAARKVGAHELDPEAYRAASEMRLRLDGASRARGALEAALRSLQKMGRQDDADAVERCIEEAEQLGELLLPEAARAREAVQRWRAATVAEARLTRALRDGVGTAQLSRAIKEAAAAGVKVGEARRLLKLMQALEAAMQQAAEGPVQYQALKAKIEQAEAGGCPEGMVMDAKLQLHRLLLGEVRAELDAALKLSRAAERSVAQRLSSLKAVLDKADVVLAMDEELQEQQRQQVAAAAAAAASRAGGSEAGPSEASDEGPFSSSDQQQKQGPAGARSLQRSDTGLSASSASGGTPAAPLGRAEPGSGSGLPPGITGTSRLASFASDTGSPMYAAAAAAAAAAVAAEGAAPSAVAPSVYVSAAPSVQLETAGSDDADVAVLLEATSGETVLLSILLPAAAEAEGEEAAEGAATGSDSEGELPPELAGDELAVVRHMVKQARRLLRREEAEQARIERERQEEARLRREQQQKEKAERERADRERAEKARAERAERKAALEQQKAERRERERQQRLEKERQRQEREKLAKEHFALLQKQRRLLAQVQPATAPMPEVPALPLGSAAPGLLPPAATQQAEQHSLSVGGTGLFSLPAAAPAAAGLDQHAAALDLWATARPSDTEGAEFSGLLQHVQHDRSDSLERLSEQQGLLDLLNDQTPNAGAAAAAASDAPFGRGTPEPPEPAAGGPAGAAADALHSPAGTQASDAWEGPAAAAAAAGLGGGSLGPPALGSGRWSSMEGSIEGLPGPEPALSPDPSPLKRQGVPADAGSASSGGFLSLGGALWLGGGPAGSGAGGAVSRASWSSLDAPSLGGAHALAQHGGASSAGLLWGSSGNLAAAAGGGASASPSKLSVQDDLALTGLGGRLWKSGASGSGDGWAEVLGGAARQGGSLLTSPQRLSSAGGAAPSGLAGNPSLALLQQQRQQQLIAALDAAKAQLAVQQHHQQQQRQLCKYFVHGFCREGDNCRFSHALPSAGADAQHAQHMLGLQRLSGGTPAPPAAQQQPGAGSLLSFGAPGAAAFAGSGAPGSNSGSRSGTPDIRLVGAGPSPASVSTASAQPPASTSGFSVNAPSFSPREPLGSGGSNAAPPLPPGTASLPAFAGLGTTLPLDAFAGGGGRYSRTSSAVNSAFATPRDDLHLSTEVESFHDAYAGIEGGDDPAQGGERAFGGNGYRGGAAQYGGHRPRGIGAYQAYDGGFGGGGEADEGGEEYADVREAWQQDSLGLPSEASLFQDLPAFMKDTTDE